MARAASVTRDPGPAPRRRRRGSELVVADLLDAALVEFAAHGFDGASTRAIAERAGAHQPQINYYFSSKEQLWRAAVDRLFALLAEAVDPSLSAVDGAAGAAADLELFAEGIRRFVRFSAARPELHRIMNLESTSDSDRLRWIVDTHVRPRYDILAAGWELVRATGAGAPLTAAEAFQLVIGFGALPYANAPMLRELGAGDPADPARVEAHADRLLALLLPDPRPAPRRRRR